MTDSESVEFELVHPLFGYPMAILLRKHAGLWAAIAEGADGRLDGIGATAREALTGALAPLGARAVAHLMADPTLFGASVRVIAA